MTQLDLTVIILTYNEEIHISRCINNISTIAKNIFIIDSYSTDRTVEIAQSLGASTICHKWPGNQAEQFNWALSNLPIKTEWILRLDADEYLLEELKDELKAKLDSIPDSITGIELKRKHIFLEKWIKKGTYPIKILRLFRTGKAQSEVRLMDEHIALLEGQSILLENDFVDHNLNSLEWWITKHNNYSIREAIELIDVEYNILDRNKKTLQGEAAIKRTKKIKYAQSPLFLRSFLYFCYRYFFKLGFLEGKEGFLWHFLQGWWYRTLVDAKIYEIKKHCGSDKEKILKYIQDNYNIALK